MKQYEKAADETMIKWIRGGDSKAMDDLLRKYTSTVKKEARKMYLIGADEEDLIQEEP